MVRDLNSSNKESEGKGHPVKEAALLLYYNTLLLFTILQSHYSLMQFNEMSLSSTFH